MTFNRREILLLPNLLSLARIFLLPFLILLIAHGHDRAALALVLLGMVFDILDGFLARRLHQITELGKVLDPLGDKLAVGALVITLTIFKGFPIWAAAIIIIRDLILLIGALVFMNQGKPTPMSNLPGKLTALIWAALVISYLTPWILVREALLVVAVAMVPISFFLYLVRVLSLRRQQ
jgi:cardiolipin synthase